MGKKGHTHTTGEHYIFSRVTEDRGKWVGIWFVGTRSGRAEWNTQEEATEYCKRSIDREACNLIR